MKTKTAEEWAALVAGRALCAYNEGRDPFEPAYPLMKKAMAEVLFDVAL